MMSLSALLARAKASIPHPSEAQTSLVAKLDELQARLGEGLLRVAALGQFKRGKSTLLNALLGAPLLPMGVTPVTAIPTFIKAGDSTRIRVTFDGDKEPIVVSDSEKIPQILEEYISEAQNPHNRLRVAGVSIEAPSAFLRQGVTLVDTPGVGSTFLHNTNAAEAALSECDVAVFVLSADPPITATEVDYLEKVRKLIPKIFFVLNKADLLDEPEKKAAVHFLAKVLAERGFSAREGIFFVSSRRGLQAQVNGDTRALDESGISRLERTLAGELARERREILFATGRQRSISVVGELLFQSELECKALLMPADVLKQKSATFETSAVQFEDERQRLSDLLSLDRKRLLRELEAETDRIWQGAKAEVRIALADCADVSTGSGDARKKIAASLGIYFEQALQDSVRAFQAKLEALVRVHRDRAGALVNLVRQTAADLMEIPVSLPKSEEAFQPRREPYWVAPEPAISLIDLSAGVAARLLPRALRDKRAREKLIEDAEKAALRNVANLDWCSRQNIEDSLRRFETEFSNQLGAALQATRQAMQLALQKRAARSEAIEVDVAQAKNSIAALAQILSELQASEAEPPHGDQPQGAQAC
jgi:ribosome biogenesis GTPase A